MRPFKVILFIFLAGTCTAFYPHSAIAQVTDDIRGNIGLGIILGEPTGASVKYWLSNRSAFDIGAAWSLADRNQALHMHSDFLWHSWFQDNERLAFYYGLGGRVIFADNAEAGVRAPIGLTYIFDNFPLDIFLEAAPILDITPDVNFSGNGGVGLRYYF